MFRFFEMFYFFLTIFTEFRLKEHLSMFTCAISSTCLIAICYIFFQIAKKVKKSWKISLELLEYLVRRSWLAWVSMKIFESDDSSKRQGCLLCANEYVLNCSIADVKGTCSSWVCFCVDSRDVLDDTMGG